MVHFFFKNTLFFPSEKKKSRKFFLCFCFSQQKKKQNYVFSLFSRFEKNVGHSVQDFYSLFEAFLLDHADDENFDWLSSFSLID